MNPKTMERLILDECEYEADLKKRYEQVRRIGIDEQSKRKGKGDYMCILTDLDRGILLDVLPNRKAETIIAHFKNLGEAFCDKITDVCFDNWDAYILVAKTCFKNARLSLDRFHTTKSLNECLDGFRKKLRKDFKDNPNFKKLKWVLYKQFHKLTDAELDILDAAYVDCPELKVLYTKREEFHHILDNETTVEGGRIKLDVWIESLKTQNITVFDSFVKMISSKKDMVLNYITHHLSNAVTEGLNNLIRSIRRVSFGMTNFKNLRLRSLGIST
jgi:transposase